jgi:hypothetical protein
MDASVTSSRVDGKMPKQVGDGFERHAAAMKPCGHRVPQDMNSLVI